MALARTFLLWLTAVGTCTSRRSADVASTDLNIASGDLHDDVTPAESLSKIEMAREFEEPWTESEHFKHASNAVATQLSLLSNNDTSEEKRKEIIHSVWELASQASLKTTRMRCVDLCAVCAPSQDAFAESSGTPLKSVFFHRSKSQSDRKKMRIVAPVDAAAGAFKGAITGFFGSIGAGVIVGKAIASKVNKARNATDSSLILGSLAGLAGGTISAGVTFAVFEHLFPALGFFSGAGITGKFTQCERVGVEVASNGKQEPEMSFKNPKNKSRSGLDDLWAAMKTSSDSSDVGEDIGDVEAPQSIDITAISHCVRTKSRNFDVRHVLECVKHSQLCGSGNALLFPTRSRKACAAASDAAHLEAQASKESWGTGLLNTWGEVKARAQCLRLLCRYGGLQAGASQASADAADAEEGADSADKESLQEDVKAMTECSNKFTGKDGNPLTLDTEEERKQCSKFEEA